MRALPFLLLLVLTACGSATPSEDVAADRSPAEVLAGVEDAARDAGTARYEALTESARGQEPLAVEGRMSGEIDLRDDSGTADLELLPLQDLAAEAGPQDADAAADLAALGSMRLSWTAEEITVDMGGEQHTGPRAGEDDSLIARVPGEPAGLLRVAASAREVTDEGSEDLDGTPVRHYRGVVDPAEAVEQGLGTQAQLAVAQLPELPVEAWVDGDGRAVRVRVTVTTPSIGGQLRTTVTTYDYAY